MRELREIKEMIAGLGNPPGSAADLDAQIAADKAQADADVDADAYPRDYRGRIDIPRAQLAHENRVIAQAVEQLQASGESPVEMTPAKRARIAEWIRGKEFGRSNNRIGNIEAKASIAVKTHGKKWISGASHRRGH